jgi:hypothetical protein
MSYLTAQAAKRAAESAEKKNKPGTAAKKPPEKTEKEKPYGK